jgi:GNAT superfamily N-acetyltransferase
MRLDTPEHILAETERIANMRLLKSLLYLLLDTFVVFKKKGVQAGLANLGKVLRRIFYTRLELVLLAKSLSIGESPLEPLPGLIIRQVKEKEELAVMDDWVGPKKAARFRRVFDDGSVAFLAWQDGQLAGWGWIAYEIDPEVNRVHIPLPPGDATLYDLFVLPAYRGQGIAQRLVACRLQLLRAQGYKRAVISCSKGDIPALKLAQKAGYTRIGESCHTRFLFWDRLEFNLYDR